MMSIKEDVKNWLTTRIATLLKYDESEISATENFSSFGIDSVSAIAIINDLSVYVDKTLSPTMIWNYPSIEKLAIELEAMLNSTNDNKFDNKFDNTFEDEQINLKNCLNSNAFAIIGIGCNFPNADSPESFWDVLLNEQNCITSRQFNGTEIKGGYICNTYEFDCDFFKVSPKEAQLIDPQQRLLLKTVWKSLEDAGLSLKALEKSRVGVYIGASGNDYQQSIRKADMIKSVYSITGNSSSIISNRISYFFNFQGPSISIDTACSSSLVAVHTACSAIRENDCDIAIAGGVNLILDKEITNAFEDAGMLSKDGQCKTFDSRADGYVRSEGVGVIVIKSLEEALKNNDDIYAVIRGSAVNQDGHTNGITAPNKNSQIDVIRAAYKKSGIKISDVQYVEAHGTGTMLGDPIEAQALGEAVGREKTIGNKLRIGSVKTNIGHLEAAAGIAGIIKVALCLKNHKYVRSLNYIKQNTYIDFDALKIKVQVEEETWHPVSELGRCVGGVSSFGFGGTNAHVVLTDAPPRKYNERINNNKYFIFPFSTHNKLTIKKQLESSLNIIDNFVFIA